MKRVKKKKDNEWMDWERRRRDDTCDGKSIVLSSIDRVRGRGEVSSTIDSGDR